MSTEQFNKLITELKSLHRKLWVMEHNMMYCPPFKTQVGFLTNPVDVKLARFNSAVLTTAYNHVRKARMIFGDILLEFDEFKPYREVESTKTEKDKREHLILSKVDKIDWKSKIYQEYRKATPILPEGADENTFEQFAKPGMIELSAIYSYRKFLCNAEERKGLFYKIAKMFDTIQAGFVHHLKNDTENVGQDSMRRVALDVYLSTLLTELKMANCHLGLRIGEILE